MVAQEAVTDELLRHPIASLGLLNRSLKIEEQVSVSGRGEPLARQNMETAES